MRAKEATHSRWCLYGQLYGTGVEGLPHCVCYSSPFLLAQAEETLNESQGPPLSRQSMGLKATLGRTRSRPSFPLAAILQLLVISPPTLLAASHSTLKGFSIPLPCGLPGGAELTEAMPWEFLGFEPALFSAKLAPRF